MSFQSAIDESRSLVQRIKEEFGCPGVCVAVSVNGETVWSEGFGFADIENGVVCSPETVMRIASISKPLTATAAGLLADCCNCLFEESSKCTGRLYHDKIHPFNNKTQYCRETCEACM